jgi:hypothetical protein
MKALLYRVQALELQLSKKAHECNFAFAQMRALKESLSDPILSSASLDGTQNTSIDFALSRPVSRLSEMFPAYGEDADSDKLWKTWNTTNHHENLADLECEQVACRSLDPKATKHALPWRPASALATNGGCESAWTDSVYTDSINRSCHKKMRQLKPLPRSRRQKVPTGKNELVSEKIKALETFADGLSTKQTFILHGEPETANAESQNLGSMYDTVSAPNERTENGVQRGEDDGEESEERRGGLEGNLHAPGSGPATLPQTQTLLKPVPQDALKPQLRHYHV